MMSSKTLILIIISTLLLILSAVVSAGARSLAVPSVHEILAQYGLPKGLLPKTASKYSITTNGELEVELETDRCRVSVHMAKDLVYQKRVSAKISPRKLQDVKGILLHVNWFSAEMTVTRIESPVPPNKMMEVHVHDPPQDVYFFAADFDEIPQCIEETWVSGEERKPTIVAVA